MRALASLRTKLSLLWAVSLVCGNCALSAPRFVLDVSETPKLEDWGRQALRTAKEWHPRIVNLLLSDGFVVHEQIVLRIKKSKKGIAGTSGAKITIHSNWVDSHPEDLGLVIHELVHVVQRYPKHEPGWITEGIADYIRWAIYEGKPLKEFPVPDQPQAFRGGYQVAAGFFLWLETHRSAGIVRQLNRIQRGGGYREDWVKEKTGASWKELWHEYRGFRRRLNRTKSSATPIDPSQ